MTGIAITRLTHPGDRDFSHPEKVHITLIPPVSHHTPPTRFDHLYRISSNSLFTSRSKGIMPPRRSARNSLPTPAQSTKASSTASTSPSIKATGIKVKVEGGLLTPASMTSVSFEDGQNVQDGADVEGDEGMRVGDAVEPVAKGVKRKRECVVQDSSSPQNQAMPPASRQRSSKKTLPRAGAHARSSSRLRCRAGGRSCRRRRRGVWTI